MKRIIELLAAGVTDDTGVFLDSGKVRFYEAGTTTLRTVYKNFELTEPHANPATLDQAGRLVAYTDTRLRLVIEDSLGSVVHTWDHVGTSDSDVAVATNSESLAGDGLHLNEGDGSLQANVDGTTIGFNPAGQLQVVPHGISGDQIAPSPVIQTSVQIGEDGPVLTEVGDFLQVSKGLNLNGIACQLVALTTKAVALLGLPIVVSAPLGIPTQGLMFVRGRVDSAGVSEGGEGFTSATGGTGIYTVTFTTPFADIPTVELTLFGNYGLVNLTAVSTSAFTIQVNQLSAGAPVAANRTFHFTATGKRA